MHRLQPQCCTTFAARLHHDNKHKQLTCKKNPWRFMMNEKVQVPPKATVITEAELAQMKRRAIITSLADEEAARAERENMLEV